MRECGFYLVTYLLVYIPFLPKKETRRLWHQAYVQTPPPTPMGDMADESEVERGLFPRPAPTPLPPVPSCPAGSARGLSGACCRCHSTHSFPLRSGDCITGIIQSSDSPHESLA